MCLLSLCCEPKPPVILSAFLGYPLGLEMESRPPRLWFYFYASWTPSSCCLPGRFSLCREVNGSDITPCCVPGKGPVGFLHLYLYLNTVALVLTLQKPRNPPPPSSPCSVSGVPSVVDELGSNRGMSLMYQYPW